MNPKKPVKHDNVHAFSLTGRVRSQVKRLEVGNFVACTPYAHVYHGVKEPTENMIEYLSNFASDKMIIKCYEKIKIEWMFEDIKRASLVTLEDEGAEGGGSLTWIRLELHQPPLWSQKKKDRENVRTVSAWEKPVRQHTPPTRWGEEVFQDVRKDPTFGIAADRPDDARVMHLAFHTLPVTWVRYFQFPIQAGRMKEYDQTLRDELIASLPPARRPFDDVWSNDLHDAQTCTNCDDGETPCAVYCHECERHFCKQCDIVLHKSRTNCVHRRNCVLLVSEAAIAARQLCPPCQCERDAEQCTCAQAHVYCALQCRCSKVNMYNYRSQADEINIQDDFFEHLRSVGFAPPFARRYYLLTLQQSAGPFARRRPKASAQKCARGAV